MTNMIITRINYNWYATPENGEEYAEYKIGVNDCVEIMLGNEDVKFYKVYFQDGRVEWIFNPNKVYYAHVGQQPVKPEADISNKLMEFEKAAKPLIEYLCKNHDPHSLILISWDHAELLSGVMAFPCTKYIVD